MAELSGFSSNALLPVGICLCHRERIRIAGYFGALLYGLSFVYFQHSTLYALQLSIANYHELWQQLGALYTAYGAVMVFGGILFGAVLFKSNEVSRIGSGLFLAGLVAHVFFFVMPAAEYVQVIASSLRNVGLIGIGASLFSHRNQV